MELEERCREGAAGWRGWRHGGREAAAARAA